MVFFIEKSFFLDFFRYFCRHITNKPFLLTQTKTTIMKKFLLLVAAIACTMGMAAQETLTVFDGTDTNSRVPLDSYWWDASSPFYTQVIFPAEALEEMEGATITGIKFYLNADGVKFSGGKFDLQMGTTTETTFTNAIAEGLTDVLTGQTAPETGLTEVEFTFATPFVYTGGNLVYSCHFLEKGTYSSSFFYGVNQTTNTAWARNDVAKFIPKTTFTYTPAQLNEYDAKVTPQSLDFGKLNPGQSTVLNVTVKNKGLNAFTPAVTTAAPFSAQYDGAALASGESVEIPVTYAPTELGDFAGELSINCGEAGTYTVALTGQCTDVVELVVCDGTATSAYTPFYGSYYDSENTKTQMIYPAEMLANIKDAEIIGVQFESKFAFSFTDGQLQLSLGETETSEFTKTDNAVDNPVTGLTEMATIVPGASKILEFTFANPYKYEGGNLAVQTLVTETGSYSSTTFYGVATENYASYYEYTWNNATTSNAIQFLPKMTILYRISQAEPQTVTVTGVVTDTDQQPLEGVNVMLTVTPEVEGAPRTAAEPQTYTATTDATGAYTIEMTPVEGATIDMTFAKDGYKTVTLNDVDVEDEVNVTMEADDLTGIETIEAAGNGKVTYVNAMGQTSDRPFQGVNIVVRDGKTIGKIVK